MKFFFREPESQADTKPYDEYCDYRKKRTDIMSIISVAGKWREENKMHDYFYHNMGQTMNLTAADGSSLFLQPTEELAFCRGTYICLFLFV